jgi:hypothetical protein
MERQDGIKQSFQSIDVLAGILPVMPTPYVELHKK